jgi:hypothetical protein
VKWLSILRFFLHALPSENKENTITHGIYGLREDTNCHYSIYQRCTIEGCPVRLYTRNNIVLFSSVFGDSIDYKVYCERQNTKNSIHSTFSLPLGENFTPGMR